MVRDAALRTGGSATGGAIAQEGESFSELRPLASELPAGEAGLFAYARALHLWRAI
ncbi:MAG: hypothetical protein HC933_06025, partial [Pleurocapsa sp. SU_196_0]|nr:hypothetical protein [Pleurocapsa sp. SU_196_0]